MDRSRESVLSRRDPSDRNLAVYCQGMQETEPVRRERYDWVGRNVPQPWTANLSVDQLRPCPTGRAFFVNAFQAVNCLATFI